jgi:hypothetical protein
MNVNLLFKEQQQTHVHGRQGLADLGASGRERRGATRNRWGTENLA